MIVPLLFAAAVLRPEPVSRSEHRTPLAEPSLDWTAVEATAYCSTGSRNAAGDWPIVGTVAANGYPLGTRLDVEGRGLVTVEDRSAPGATQLDIYMGSGPECLAAATEFGRQTLLVRRAA